MKTIFRKTPGAETNRRTGVLLLLAVTIACGALSGCAAITNPVANGIPVDLVPPELLAESKEDLVQIPLRLLQQPPPEVYRLAPGDVLGVYVEGILGQLDTPPPVNIPTGDLPPSTGFPIPVRRDGAISLPQVPPIKVEGMSLVEAEDAVIRAYTVDKNILQPNVARILVTLQFPRQTRVNVIREDSSLGAGLALNRGGRFLGGTSLLNAREQGSGNVVDLPAYENDVLTALTQTGGLPGQGARNEVVIQRAPNRNGRQAEAEEIRIPLRMRRGEQPPFNPEDVILHPGDTVLVEARDTEVFYTGGLLPPGQYPLPRDYDLDVVKVISTIGGPILNGGVNASNLSGGIVGAGLGNPSPSLVSVLRPTPDGGQVNIRVDLNRAIRDPRENILIRPGDTLVLQETPGEATARYASTVVRFDFFFRFLNRGDATGTATALVP